MIPTAFLATVIIFLLMKLVPGDVATAIVYGDEESEEGYSQQETEERIARIRHKYGLDRPLPVQYFDWLKTVGRGEFGISLWQNRPVRDIIMERLPRTAQLAGLIMFFTVVWALPLGVVAALVHNSKTDQFIRVITILGLSVPTIWLAVIFLFTFSRYIGWIPPLEWKSIFEAPVHNLSMVGIPALIVAYNFGAPVMRMTRSQMLEVLREDYIRTARAKGLAQQAVLVRHALRNAVLPVLTQFGGLFSALITGLVIVETVFHIPGMGRSMVDAIGTRDWPVVQGLVLVNVALILLINLAVDILYSVVDPRIRYS